MKCERKNARENIRKIREELRDKEEENVGQLVSQSSVHMTSISSRHPIEGNINNSNHIHHMHIILMFLIYILLYNLHNIYLFVLTHVLYVIRTQN